MAKYLIRDTTLTAIGDAIRRKNGYSDRIDPVDMPEEIGKIKGEGVELPELTNPAGAAQIREGYEAIDANGAKIEGEMPTVEMYVDEINIDDASGTITARAKTDSDRSGYVQTSASPWKTKYLPTLAGMTITPGSEDQVIEKHRWLTGDITIKAASLDLPDLDNPAGAAQIRSGYKAIGANGAIIEGGMPDAVVTVGQPGIDGNGVASIDISCSAGYITSLQRTITQQLPTQGATTIEPGAEDQVIDKHRWLTGDITVKGVALQEKTVTPGEAEVVVTPDADYTGLAKVTVEAVTGGGGSGGGGGGNVATGDYRVKVIDYDGTVLAEQYLNEGDVFTLPDAPTHNGLVFDGWSSSAPITDNTVTVEKNNIMIGAMYYTASGATEVDIVLTAKTGLTFAFYTGTSSSHGLVGATSIDWGDGTTDNTRTHTYSTYGSYTIKIYGATKISGVSEGGLVPSGDMTVVAVRLASGLSLSYCSFKGAYSLKSISIPSITSMGDHTFNACYRLAALVLPQGITSVRASTFIECFSIKDVVIPHSVTTTNGSIFSSCYGLVDVTLPNSINTLGATNWKWCYGLRKIKIPKSVTSVGKWCFQFCYALEVCDFTEHTSVPEMDTTAFPQVPAGLKILVPANLYSQWIAATTWSALAYCIVAV